MARSGWLLFLATMAVACGALLDLDRFTSSDRGGASAGGGGATSSASAGGAGGTGGQGGAIPATCDLTYLKPIDGFSLADPEESMGRGGGGAGADAARPDLPDRVTSLAIGTKLAIGGNAESFISAMAPFVTPFAPDDDDLRGYVFLYDPGPRTLQWGRMLDTIDQTTSVGDFASVDVVGVGRDDDHVFIGATYRGAIVTQEGFFGAEVDEVFDAAAVGLYVATLNELDGTPDGRFGLAVTPQGSDAEVRLRFIAPHEEGDGLTAGGGFKGAVGGVGSLSSGDDAGFKLEATRGSNTHGTGTPAANSTSVEMVDRVELDRSPLDEIVAFNHIDPFAYRNMTIGAGGTEEGHVVRIDDGTGIDRGWRFESDAGTVEITGIAVNPEDELWVVGTFSGTMKLRNSGRREASSGARDVFLARLNPNEGLASLTGLRPRAEGFWHVGAQGAVVVDDPELVLSPAKGDERVRGVMVAFSCEGPWFGITAAEQANVCMWWFRPTHDGCRDRFGVFGGSLAQRVHAATGNASQLWIGGSYEGSLFPRDQNQAGLTDHAGQAPRSYVLGFAWDDLQALPEPTL